MISYAKIFLGLKVRNLSPQSLRSLTFEDGIDKLAKSLNAIKYVYTTSSCGGHIKDSPSGVNPVAPYVHGAVWTKYGSYFMENITKILMEKHLSAITLTFESPARKRPYLWFEVGFRCKLVNDEELERMCKKLSRLARGITKLAFENPDPVWFGLLPS